MTRRSGYFIDSAVRTDDGEIVGLARLQPIRRRFSTYRSEHSDHRVVIGRDEQSNLCLDVTFGHHTVNIALNPRLHRTTAVRFARDLLEP